jgi:hypothetical protein
MRVETNISFKLHKQVCLKMIYNKKLKTQNLGMDITQKQKTKKKKKTNGKI